MNVNCSILEMVRKIETKKIILPTIQRGFVWKPYQIENLWDSLLRGYSFGCFTARYNKEKLELLDGQQRAVAFALGFQAAFDTNILRNFRCFIDQFKPRGNDGRKFIIRIITRSHPWGYDFVHNTKRLDSDQINDALKCFGLNNNKNKYYNIFFEDPDKFYPFSSIRPIPLNLFVNHFRENISQLDNKNFATLEEEIEKQRCSKKHEQQSLNVLLRYLNYYDEDFKKYKETARNIKTSDEAKDYVKNYIKCDDYYTVEELWGFIVKAVTEDKILLDIPKVLSDHKTKDDIENYGKDDIENLFTRLNTAGTRITNEELNYSIMKFKIEDMDTNLISDIEEQCGIKNAGNMVMHPARFITLAYRLFEIKETESKYGLNYLPGLNLDINTRQFQKSLDELEYLKKFKNFIQTTVLKGKFILTFRDIFCYSNKNAYGLPYTLFIKISKTAPAIVLMVLYRMIMKDDMQLKYNELKNKIIALTTAIYFLGKDKVKKSGHSKIIQELWPSISNLDTDSFWSFQTFRRLFDLDNDAKNEIDFRLPEPNFKYEKKPKSDTIYAQKYIFTNHDFLLYAQRETLCQWFEDYKFDLDDTNVPYDLDHIFPQNFLKKTAHKGYGFKKLSALYNTNGNLRAWPLSLNRYDQDANLRLKLDPLNKNNFKEGDSEKIKDAEEFWLDCPYLMWTKNNIITGTSKDISKKVRDRLCALSFYVNDWLYSKNSVITEINKFDKPKDQKIASELIFTRNNKIYSEWHKVLKHLGKQISPFTSFEESLKKKLPYFSWHIDKGKKFNKNIVSVFYEDYTYAEINKRFYISLGIEQKQSMITNIGRDGIEFIVILKNDDWESMNSIFKKSTNDQFIKNFKFLKGDSENNEDNESFIGCIWWSFTLTDKTDHGVQILLSNIESWLENIDDIFKKNFKEEFKKNKAYR